MAQPEITVDQITPQPAFDGVNISGVDSDLLSGQIGSFYQDASNLNAGTISSGRLTGTYTINISGSASQLNNQSGSFYQDASNLNAGTINDARLPATISSDITGNAATSTTASNSNALGGSAAANWAKLASPIFTGNPRAPTAGSGDNDTTIATTAFVQNAISGGSITKSESPGLATTSNLRTWAHGLGSEPDIVTIIIQCLTAENGYSVGDRLMISTGVASWQTSADQNENGGMVVQVDATNVYIRRFNRLQINHKTNLDVRVALTYSSWNYYITAMVVT